MVSASTIIIDQKTTPTFGPKEGHKKLGIDGTRCTQS